MKKRLFAISLTAVLLLAGCGGGSNASTTANAPASSAPSTDQQWEDMSETFGGWNAGDSIPDVEYNGSQAGSVYQNPDAKLIRRAELEIQTEQFDESVKTLNQLVADCGGYYENASVYGGGRRDAYANRRGEYIVRVPSGKYSQFFQNAGELGYVTSSAESSEDVGEQYYDTEARLKAQRTKQERLLTLLEKAETMEDIIALENALSDVEYQIEMHSSELRRYDALIDFSTFNISLYEVGRVTEEVGKTASLGQRMTAGFQASLRGLGQGTQNLLVWMSYNFFFVIILAALSVAAVIVGRRELKKFKGENAEKNTEKIDEKK